MVYSHPYEFYMYIYKFECTHILPFIFISTKIYEYNCLGEISIVKTKTIVSDTGISEFEENTTLVRLFRFTFILILYQTNRSGHSFGETALENSTGGLRSASALVSKDSSLLRLGANDYQSVLTEYKEIQREQIAVVLGSSPLFSHWDEEVIEQLTSVTQVRYYSANTEILKVGEKSTSLMMIKNGVVTMLKTVQMPKVFESSPTATSQSQFATSSGMIRRFEGDLTVSQEEVSLPPRPHTTPTISNKKSYIGQKNLILRDRPLEEVPGLWVLERNWDDRISDAVDDSQERVKREFTVAVLGSGEVFGQLPLIGMHLSIYLSI